MRAKKQKNNDIDDNNKIVVENKKQHKAIALVKKQRIYELITLGYNTTSIKKIMVEEFDMNINTIENYIREMTIDIKRDYAEHVDILREKIVVTLFEILSNSCKTTWEKFEAIKLIGKYTGLDREISQDTSKNIEMYPTTFEVQIVEKSENENDKNIEK